LQANVIAEIAGEYVRGVTLYVFHANFVLYLLIIRAFAIDTPCGLSMAFPARPWRDRDALEDRFAVVGDGLQVLLFGAART
jgi:hypothetical protein